MFGLNHLSWARSVTRDGVDLLPGLLANDDFRAATDLSMFEPDLVRMLGMWPNQYLYYFYYAEEAIAGVDHEGVTRGEEIRDLTARLVADLKAIDPERDPDAAAKRFRAYHRRRGATYMALAREGAPSSEEADRDAFDDESWTAADEEGYASVMLDVVEALESGRPLDTALNVPNEGAIDGLAADDVVEVSCRVDGDGVHVRPIGAIPAGQLALIRAVKAYERLTVRAIEAAISRPRHRGADGAPARRLVSEGAGSRGRLPGSAPRLHRLVTSRTTEPTDRHRPGRVLLVGIAGSAAYRGRPPR